MTVERLLLDADRLLESHPLWRLDRWSGMARREGHNEAEKERFVEESRRLISIWGGPSLSDYSARVWSGVIRDFYVPRLRRYLNAKADGTNFDFRSWDERWYSSPTVSKIEPYPDPFETARKLVARAAATDAFKSHRPADAAAFWSPFELKGGFSTISFTIDWTQFEKARGIRFVPVRGHTPVKVKSIRCAANRYDRARIDTDLEISAKSGAAEVIFDKLDAPAPLSKEVSISVRVEAPAAADNYAAIEIIY